MIVVIFAIASLFYYIVLHDFSEEVSPNKEYKPSVIGKNIKGYVYGETGLREYNYKASQVEYFKVADVTRFINPFLFAYNLDNNTKKWEIQSNDGIYNTDDSITLYNDVKIASYKIDPKSQENYKDIRMFTSYLELDLDTMDVRSNQQVDMVNRVMSEDHGKFLEGNVETNQYRLNEDCHAIIQPDDFEHHDQK